MIHSPCLPRARSYDSVVFNFRDVAAEDFAVSYPPVQCLFVCLSVQPLNIIQSQLVPQVIMNKNSDYLTWSFCDSVRLCHLCVRACPTSEEKRASVTIVDSTVNNKTKGGHRF